MQAFAEVVDVEVPQAMIDRRATSMVEDYLNRMSYQGIKPEDFLRITKQTINDLIEGYKTDAQQLIKMELGLKALAKQENLVVDDAGVDEEIDRLAKAYGMSSDDVRNAVDLEEVRKDALLRKANERLIEMSTH